MPDPASDRDLLLATAEEAGEIAMRHFRRDPQKWDKSDGMGPVTEADLEINAMLRASLLTARPEYGWLSEEDEDTHHRLAADRVFIVDPIDGTRAFIAGEKGFSTALAVAERGQLIAAAVHLPARGESFSAAIGEGATKNDNEISASGVSEPEDATILAARVQMRPDNWPGGEPPVERHFRSSLAWRMCLVAEGRFDSMATFRSSFEWDIAAGALIVAEAGGTVTDGNGHQMIFNSADGMQPGVLAAPDALHAALMRYRRPDAD